LKRVSEVQARYNSWEAGQKDDPETAAELRRQKQIAKLRSAPGANDATQEKAQEIFDAIAYLKPQYPTFKDLPKEVKIEVSSEADDFASKNNLEMSDITRLVLSMYNQ